MGGSAGLFTAAECLNWAYPSWVLPIATQVSWGPEQQICFHSGTKHLFFLTHFPGVVPYTHWLQSGVCRFLLLKAGSDGSVWILSIVVYALNPSSQCGDGYPLPTALMTVVWVLLKICSSLFADMKLKEPLPAQLSLPTCPPCTVHASSCLCSLTKPSGKWNPRRQSCPGWGNTACLVCQISLQ